MNGRTQADGRRVRAQVAGMHLEGVHFEGLHFEGKHFEGVRLNGMRLNGMRLNRLRFNRTRCARMPADHRPTDLTHAVAVRMSRAGMPTVTTPAMRPGHRTQLSIFSSHPRAMPRARTGP